MFDFLKSKTKTSPGSTPDPRSANAKAHGIPERRPVQMTYASRDVALPADFLSLTAPPPDARPVTITRVDWASSALPGNEGRFAVVLDNVLSPSECAELLRLAEASVDLDRMNHNNNNGNSNNSTGGDDQKQNPWIPAMVNAGGGYEVLDSKYRNSDRIVWDNQEAVDRLWARCLQGRAGEVLRERLDVLEGEELVGPWMRRGPDNKYAKQRWEFRRLNERMRFLKYGPGQFFRPHCDSPYGEEVGGKHYMTFFTVHLYLNDSVAEAGETADLVGGATSFLSGDGKKKVDVDPKAGRVLIFQHRRLYHAGDDVIKGTKYTMRTDIIYEFIEPEESNTDKIDKTV